MGQYLSRRRSGPFNSCFNFPSQQKEAVICLIWILNTNQNSASQLGFPILFLNSYPGNPGCVSNIQESWEFSGLRKYKYYHQTWAPAGRGKGGILPPPGISKLSLLLFISVICITYEG